MYRCFQSPDRAGNAGSNVGLQQWARADFFLRRDEPTIDARQPVRRVSGARLSARFCRASLLRQRREATLASGGSGRILSIHWRERPMPRYQVRRQGKWRAIASLSMRQCLRHECGAAALGVARSATRRNSLRTRSSTAPRNCLCARGSAACCNAPYTRGGAASCNSPCTGSSAARRKSIHTRSSSGSWPRYAGRLQPKPQSVQPANLGT